LYLLGPVEVCQIVATIRKISVEEQRLLQNFYSSKGLFLKLHGNCIAPYGGIMGSSVEGVAYLC